MAEEKKPKIDLKARLGKTAVQTPPPMAVPAPAASSGGVPMPAPSSSRSAGAPPPGMPVGPPPFAATSGPRLDPSNPLAAAVAPRVQQAPYRAPAPPPQPQRIEVDEVAVQDARKGARRQGFVAGMVVAIVFGAVGYVGGSAQETSAGHKKGVQDAKDLAGDIAKAKDQLKTLADKMEDGRTKINNKQFPDTLSKDLGGINVDFDGSKLAGRRFTGMSTETMSSLIEFVVEVTTLNDRKLAVNSLLNRLQKPLTEQFANAGKTNISYVMLLGREDEAKNYYGILAPLTAPIPVTPPNITLPDQFTFTDPISRQNGKLGKYTTGDLTKPAAVYVLPKSMDAACPSDASGQALQLGSQMGHVITDIKGVQTAPDQAIVEDTKPGLMERADKLIAALSKDLT